MRIRFKIVPLLIAFFLVISASFFVIFLLTYMSHEITSDEKQTTLIPAERQEVKGPLKAQSKPSRLQTAQGNQEESDRGERSVERVSVVGDEELAKAIEEALNERLNEQESVPHPEKEDKEYDYSEYDKLFYGIEETIGSRRIIWDLDMIGIPIDISDQSGLRLFQPTPEEKRRIDELEKRGYEILQKYGVDNIEGFRKLPNVDEEDRMQVEEMVAELKALNERALRPAHPPLAGATTTTSEISHYLKDGTVITWYRRKDGALIRQVRKPDGSVLRFVAGWIDWSQYPEWMKEEVIKHARPE